jgi:curved DNA-binding protein
VNESDGRLSIKPQSLQVTIPKGIIEGQQIRLEGQGDLGFGQGLRGNLFLEIVFEAHTIFTTSKRDIFLTLPVTPWEAALGATIAVPTLGGRVDLRLPANSQTGKKLRLKGRGLSTKKQIGSQYVILAIHTPSAKTAEQKELYEKMAKLMPYNPRSGFGG